MDQTKTLLQGADIPVSDVPCRGCADPCDEGVSIHSKPIISLELPTNSDALPSGHDEFPKFDVDHETQLLGSMKPYGRQVRFRHCLIALSNPS